MVLLTQANLLQQREMMNELGGSNMTDEPIRRALDLKDAAVLAPLFATSVAISWEVGLFYVTGGFYYFSLSEHLVYAVSALPLALFFAAVFLLVTITFVPMIDRFIGGRRGFAVLLFVIGIALAIWAYPTASVFNFTIGMLACLGSIIIGSTDLRRTDPQSLVFLAILGAALPFATGVDLQVEAEKAAARGNVEMIKLKSGELRGTIMMAGERGLLVYQPSKETYIFIRSDDFLSAEYPSYDRLKRNHPGVFR
jgi:hypothetical protein